MEFFTDKQVDTALQQYIKRKEYARRYYQENKERLRQERLKKKHEKTIKNNAGELSGQQDLQDSV
jgi:hypothetical protein